MKPPAEWDGLPVVLETSEDLLTDSVAVRATMRLSPARKLVTMAQMSRELLEDVPDLDRLLFGAMDRHVRPWAYFWTAPAWEVSLFPRWDRLARFLRNLPRRG